MALINYVTRVQFEFGAIKTLPAELAALGVTRALLVSDNGLNAAGIVSQVADLFNPVTVFTETPSNPTEAAALEALAMYRAGECNGVVALGGGSAIDLGKAVALLANHGGALADYTIRNGGLDRIGPIAPLVAIPTTAGTGAEVGRAATLTLLDGKKTACVSPHLIPRVAICDPELTIKLPPYLTAATGIDALIHGIEAVFSPVFNPPAQAISIDVISRASRVLPRAVANGSDREARHDMLLAAVMSGVAFQKGLGAIHAATHPLGGYGFHHGTLNAIVLPPVIRVNEQLAPDMAAVIRQHLGLAAKEPLGDWASRYVASLGLPSRLSEIGVDREILPHIAAEAEHEHLNATNPRPLTAAEYLSLLEECY